MVSVSSDILEEFGRKVGRREERVEGQREEKNFELASFQIRLFPVWPPWLPISPKKVAELPFNGSTMYTYLPGRSSLTFFL